MIVHENALIGRAVQNDAAFSVGAPGQPRYLLAALAHSRIAVCSEFGPVGAHAIRQCELRFVARIERASTESVVEVIECEGYFQAMGGA